MLASPATNTSRSLKREAEEDLASEQRLAKRFHLLSLGKGKNQITAEDIQRIQQKLEEKYEQCKPETPASEGPILRRSRSNAFSDTMNVDDSRDRIFIHSIEDELADLESDEEHPIFIPDIERRLNMLPKSLLRPDHPQRTGNELVLYQVPESLSIPASQDGARKAIIESRQRAQQQAMLLSQDTGGFPKHSESLTSSLEYAIDDDAMDVS